MGVPRNMVVNPRVQSINFLTNAVYRLAEATQLVHVPVMLFGIAFVELGEENYERSGDYGDNDGDNPDSHFIHCPLELSSPTIFCARQ